MLLADHRSLHSLWRRRFGVRGHPVSTLIMGKEMERKTQLHILAILGLVGLAVLMGLRSAVSSPAARAAISALAFACGAVALVSILKARR
jgi:hypothetical protein